MFKFFFFSGFIFLNFYFQFRKKKFILTWHLLLSLGKVKKYEGKKRGLPLTQKMIFLMCFLVIEILSSGCCRMLIKN